MPSSPAGSAYTSPRRRCSSRPRARPRRSAPDAPRRFFPGDPPAPSARRSRRTAFSPARCSWRQVELRGPGPVLLAEPAVLQPLRVGLLVLLPTATTASRSCAATPGAPRSSPAADAPCGSAATPETAGAPGGRRRPTRAAANSAPPPWPGAGSRPPSTATYPGCGRWLGCSTPRRSTAAAPLEFLPAFGQPPARQAFVPPAKAGRSHGRPGCPAPLSSDGG